MASMSHHSQVHSYKVSRRPDLSLQFDPPVGSIELANALSLSFPLEASLSDQIRCALLLYIEAESISPAASILSRQQNAEIMSESTRNSFSSVIEPTTSNPYSCKPNNPSSVPGCRNWGTFPKEAQENKIRSFQAAKGSCCKETRCLSYPSSEED